MGVNIRIEQCTRNGGISRAAVPKLAIARPCTFRHLTLFMGFNRFTRITCFDCRKERGLGGRAQPMVVRAQALQICRSCRDTSKWHQSSSHDCRCRENALRFETVILACSKPPLLRGALEPRNFLYFHQLQRVCVCCYIKLHLLQLQSAHRCPAPASHRLLALRRPRMLLA